MYEITEGTLIKAYKPFDVVTNDVGDVGLIREVSVNSGQDRPCYQISYAVEWIVGNETKNAWFCHDDLKLHCNLFVKIAEMACHPFGGSSRSVQRLFNSMRRN